MKKSLKARFQTPYKIGVFGDSFAAWSPKGNLHMWWHILQELLPNCKVTSHGQPGSSLDYSINLLLEHHTKYDFNIWCTTDVSRRSIMIAGEWYHGRLMGPGKDGIMTIPPAPDNPRVRQDIETLFRHTEYNQEWRYRACVEYAMDSIPNLMVVPCFYQPLETSFTLMDLSEWEWKQYFPKKPITDLYLAYEDRRYGHLTNENQQILGTLISKNLHPGVFQAKLSDFAVPTQPIEECFVQKPQ